MMISEDVRNLTGSGFSKHLLETDLELTDMLHKGYRCPSLYSNQQAEDSIHIKISHT